MYASSLIRFRALALGGACAAAACVPVHAQEMPRVDIAHGAFLIHGNFCGPGNRGPGHPPIDALDLACAHHDACSPAATSGMLAHCACHGRLHDEAGLVARDPTTPLSVRETAQFIADGAEALPCAD